jgi:CheY-like chemotaxis protein/predicted regulator of Ras-like GTPase activity (Roadblock/LC7/MglB family)
MRPKRILVVDDDPDLLFLVAHSVKSIDATHQVETANNVNEALSLYQQHSFDLVITDYMMPGKTGLDLIAAINELPGNTRFAVMTAHHETGKVRALVTKLGVEFIGKPFVFTDLVQVIKNTLANSQEAGEPTGEQQQLISEETAKPVLRQLWNQTGAVSIILVDSNSTVISAVGENDQETTARLASFVTSNFSTATEVASLFGEQDQSFRSSYYEGNAVNIFAFNLQQRYFLTVVFKADVKPGSVWVYTRHAATTLAENLPLPDQGASRPGSLSLWKDFDNIVGDVN